MPPYGNDIHSLEPFSIYIGDRSWDDRVELSPCIVNTNSCYPRVDYSEYLKYSETYKSAPCCLEEKEDIKEMKEAIKAKLTEYAHENCVKKIIRNGPATIVFWDDGTKTIVKRAKGTKDDIYMAFCSAFAKKMLGSNSRIQRIIKKNLVDENN